MKRFSTDVINPLTSEVLIVANAKTFYDPSKAKHKYLIRRKYLKIYWRGSWCLLEIEIGTIMNAICFQFLSQLHVFKHYRRVLPF